MASNFRLRPWYNYAAGVVILGTHIALVVSPSIVPYDYLGPLGSILHSLAYKYERGVRIGCLAVWIIHAGEASYAYFLARRANFSNKDSLLWAIQTIFLGFTSLLPLILRIRKIRRKQLQ